MEFPHYTDDLGEVCTDRMQAFDECLAVCYREGSCAEIEGTVDIGDHFHACVDTCLNSAS